MVVHGLLVLFQQLMLGSGSTHVCCFGVVRSNRGFFPEPEESIQKSLGISGDVAAVQVQVHEL